MRVATFLVRSGFRRRAGATLVVAALLGLAAGAVLTAWAGARRTESAFPRFVEGSAGFDLSVSASGDLGRLHAADVRGARGIARMAAVHGYGAMPILPDGTPEYESGYYFTAAADELAYRELGAPLVLEGRLPDPDRADEVIVNAVTRDQGAPVGSHLDVCIFEFDEIQAFVVPEVITPAVLTDFVAQVCSVHRFTVVGVGRFLDEIVLSDVNQGQAFIVATPAFTRRAGKSASYQVVAVDLTDGADRVAFEEDVRGAVDPAAIVQFQGPELRLVVANRTVTPYVRALQLFAAAAAVASLGVLAPALWRLLATPEGERVALVAAGVRSVDRRVAGALRGALVGVAASTIAVGIAVSLSGRFPIGPLRVAEPDPGVRPDRFASLAVAAALVSIGIVAGATAGRTRLARGGRRPATIVSWLRGHGASASLLTGAGAALGRSGAGTGPVAAMSGVVVAIAAMLAAFGYQAGLVRMLDTPARFGATWDASFEAYEGVLPDETARYLVASSDVDGVSIVRRAGMSIDGVSVAVFAFDDVRGSVQPVVLEGHAPEAENEVALGGQTLERLGGRVGDEVVVRFADREIEARIVGRTLVPLLNLGDDVSIGEGAWASPQLLGSIGVTEAGIALIDLRPGLSADDLRAAMIDDGVLDEFSNSILGPGYTADLAAYDEVRWTPVLLAGLLGLLGAGVLVHVIATAVRGRRHELAVLRSLGMTGAQVRASVRWQALALVTCCLALGVPAGVSLGRVLWSSFARGIGVADDAVTPVTSVALVAAGALVAGTLLSVVPGHRAARRSPAIALKDE